MVSAANLEKPETREGLTLSMVNLVAGTILGAASMKAQHRFSLDIQQVGRADGEGAED